MSINSLRLCGEDIIGLDNHLVTNHYLNLCWHIVNWTLCNIFQPNFIELKHFFNENTFTKNLLQNVSHFLPSSMCWEYKCVKTTMPLCGYCVSNQLHSVINQIRLKQAFQYHMKKSYRKILQVLKAPGSCLNMRPSFPGMGIPMLKIRRSWDRLIFNMGIPIWVRRHLYIKTALDGYWDSTNHSEIWQGPQ